MNSGKAVGIAGIMTLLIVANENLSMDWLTTLSNLLVAEGRNPDDWSIAFCYQYLKQRMI